MTRWICPFCKATVAVAQIATNPITTCYRCTCCDYHHDERPEIPPDTVYVAPLPHSYPFSESAEHIGDAPEVI